jgi:hypothetical protein
LSRPIPQTKSLSGTKNIEPRLVFLRRVIPKIFYSSPLLLDRLRKLFFRSLEIPRFANAILRFSKSNGRLRECELQFGALVRIRNPLCYPRNILKRSPERLPSLSLSQLRAATRPLAGSRIEVREKGHIRASS